MIDDQELPDDFSSSINGNETSDQTWYRTESELRAAIVRSLRAYGIVVDTKVACAVGEADLVTSRRDVICEVKHRLTRKALFQAVGQILIYRWSLCPDARPVIIGYATPESPPLLEAINALGIQVVSWQDGRDRIWHEEATRMPMTIHRSVKLHWNIQACAQACGIESVAKLSWATQINRQSLYPVWEDRAKSVSLTLLGKLAKTLNGNVGGWFRWEGTGAEERLAWRINEATVNAGVDPTSLSWNARIYPASLNPILDGSAQAVFLVTLDRLAQALQLDTGDLFTWKEHDGT
jgi:DNA-binding Xre family transcriptional regulator